MDGSLEVDAWKELLESVPGVKRVILHPKGSKEEQGNDGNHYQKHNFYVYSSAYPSLGWEFELSRHQHSKDPRLPFTVTALFKNVGNRAKQLVAWRILCASVAGRELLPKYSEDVMTRLRQLAAEESFSSAQETAVPAEPKTKHVKWCDHRPSDNNLQSAPLDRCIQEPPVAPIWGQYYVQKEPYYARKPIPPGGWERNQQNKWSQDSKPSLDLGPCSASSSAMTALPETDSAENGFPSADDVSDRGPCSASYRADMLVDIESSDGEDDLGSHVTTSLPDAAIYANDGIFIEAEPTANADAIFDGLRDNHISDEMTAEAWPLFLTTNAITHESTKDTEMKAFKLRCFDDTEIRWRVEGPSQKNPLIENLLDLRCEVRFMVSGHRCRSTFGNLRLSRSYQSLAKNPRGHERE